MTEKNLSIEETVRESTPRSELEKPQHDEIVLIPKPSDDPRDPLNWSFSKKCVTVAILSLAMFAGYAAPFCGQLNLIQQAKLYHKTTVQITYFVSSFHLFILVVSNNQ